MPPDKTPEDTANEVELRIERAYGPYPVTLLRLGLLGLALKTMYYPGHPDYDLAQKALGCVEGLERHYTYAAERGCTYKLNRLLKKLGLDYPRF